MSSVPQRQQPQPFEQKSQFQMFIALPSMYLKSEDNETKSFLLRDRCGPNPNPEWCYLQKHSICKIINDERINSEWIKYN